jgi:sulfite exporter TauE/SafE
VTLAAVARALLLGLAAGPVCAAFCLPALAPLLISAPTPSVKGSAAKILPFALGRLAGYLAFGLVLGLLGIRGRYPHFSAAYVVLGALMVLYGLVQSFPHWGLCRLLIPRLESAWYLLLLGLTTGLNLCPPFLLAAVAAAELGQPLAGVVFFAVFFVGTSVWLLPLLFTGLLAKFRPVRLAGRILAVIAGLWFIWLGLSPLLR